MTIRQTTRDAWDKYATTRQWPGGIFPFSSWGCADDPSVVLYAGSEPDTYADPSDWASGPLHYCPRCGQAMPGYADALAEWLADWPGQFPDTDKPRTIKLEDDPCTDLATYVATLDDAAIADATQRGLYGWTADGREWIYSAAHNGLCFTGRRECDFARHPASNYPPEG